MVTLEPGRLINRNAMVPLSDAAMHFRVLIINGPRQSGKTTLLREVRRLRGGVLVSLDDAAVLAAARADPVGFVQHRDGPLFIDEVQLAGDPLIRAVKAAVDADPQPGQFFLVGSTQFLTVPVLSESLAGRAHIIDLWPLSQGELGGRAERFVDILLDRRPLPGPREFPSRRDYFDRACAGGFPEVLRRTSGRARSAWLSSYLRTVVQRDVAEVSNARYIDEMPRLVRYLAGITAQELNAARLAANVGLSDDTVRRYLPILETAYLIHRLPAWSRNLTAKVKKHPKVYFTDSGLAAHLLGVNVEALVSVPAPSAGPLLETFVVNEIAKQQTWNDIAARLYHWRDRDGAEVDLVVEADDGRVAAIEIKASATATVEDFRHLTRFRDRLGAAFVNGVVLYTGMNQLSFGDRLAALPVSAVWQ
jgi:predicted AAA+ superfamily ATPase